MDNSDLKTQVLEYLFDQYKSAPLDRVNMNSFIADRGGNAKELAFEMKNADLVREVQSATTGFIGRITIRGIRRVDPYFLENLAREALSYAEENGGAAFVRDALSHYSHDVNLAHDVGSFIERMKYATTQSDRQGFRIYLK